MRRRCEHTWEQQSVVFNPAPRSVEVTGTSESAMIRALYGFTNLTLKCFECGDVKVVSENGRFGV